MSVSEQGDRELNVLMRGIDLVPSPRPDVRLSYSSSWTSFFLSQHFSRDFRFSAIPLDSHFPLPFQTSRTRFPLFTNHRCSLSSSSKHLPYVFRFSPNHRSTLSSSSKHFFPARYSLLTNSISSFFPLTIFPTRFSAFITSLLGYSITP